MNIKIGKIGPAVVQRVGNRSLGDGIAFSNELCPMDAIESHLIKLIKSSFKFDDLKKFVAIDSVEYNMVYRFVSKIFDDTNTIIEQSNNLARHLYEQSIHPNIKIGEFYVVYFKECSFGDEIVDAIGLFKSENRETILKVLYENNSLRLHPEDGISLKKLDKGCLIFNVCKDEGYRVVVVDNTNSGSDAHYWVDNFLHVEDRNDDYHNTIQVEGFCSGFIKKLQSDDEAIYCATKAKSVAHILSSSNLVTQDQIETVFCDNEAHTRKFNDYKIKYIESYGVIPKEFTPDKEAIKRKAVTKLNSVKLGADFQLRILNPSAEIEQGFDSIRERKFVKLFFD